MSRQIQLGRVILDSAYTLNPGVGMLCMMESLVLNWNWGVVPILFPITVSLRDNGCEVEVSD